METNRDHTLVAAFLIGGGAYAVVVLDVFNTKEEPVQTTTTTTNTATPSATKTTPKEETPKDETADWKSHTVTEVGVTFKYPKDWNDATYKEGWISGDYFTANEYFHATNPQAGNNYPYATIALTVSRVKAGSQEESMITKDYDFVNNLKVGESSTKDGFTYTRKPNVTVDNISSPYYSTDASNATPRYGQHVVIKKGNTFYYLHLESNTSKGLEDNQKTFEQFLSTFNLL